MEDQRGHLNEKTNFHFDIRVALLFNKSFDEKLIVLHKEKKRKEMPISKYWHECEPVGHVLITVSRDAI